MSFTPLPSLIAPTDQLPAAKNELSGEAAGIESAESLVRGATFMGYSFTISPETSAKVILIVVLPAFIPVIVFVSESIFATVSSAISYVTSGIVTLSKFVSALGTKITSQPSTKFR